MATWRPQTFTKEATQADVDPQIVSSARKIGEAIVAVHPDLPPIFTLRHLAHLSDVDYGFLRAVVARRGIDPYRVFKVRKRAVPGESFRRFRVICVPSPSLMQVQQWICKNILALIRPHASSVAYSKGNKLVEAARVHCEARWLIKMDVRNFFESINEIAVYRVFRACGYQALVAFELTRICTRIGDTSGRKNADRWAVTKKRDGIPDYARVWKMGHLPQGAPTSPMLANLAVRNFDLRLENLADENGLYYTRYADDITLSSAADLKRSIAGRLIGQITHSMSRHGLSPNATKTRIVPPGARRVVLGLLIDGPTPRLTREFKLSMRQHLYYLEHEEVGPAAHAASRGFVAIAGMKNHLLGLAAFAKQIEPAYGDQVTARLLAVPWPV